MIVVNNDIKVLAEGLLFPEGPAFASDGSLWAVELKGENLIQYTDDKLLRYHVGGMHTSIFYGKETGIKQQGPGQMKKYGVK